MILLSRQLEPIEEVTRQLALMLLLAHQPQPIAGMGVTKPRRTLAPLGSERRIFGLPEPSLIPVTHLPGSAGADLFIGGKGARLLSGLLHPVHGIGVIGLAGQTFGQLILGAAIPLLCRLG